MADDHLAYEFASLPYYDSSQAKAPLKEPIVCTWKTKKVTCAEWAGDSNKIIYTDDLGLLHVQTVDEQPAVDTPISTPLLVGWGTTALAAAPSGLVAQAGVGCAVNLFTFQTPSPVQQAVAQHLGYVSALKFINAGLVSVSYDGTSVVTDPQTGQPILVCDAGPQVECTGCSWVPAHPALLAVGSRDKLCRVWDLNSGKVVRRVAAKYPLESCALLPDGSGLIAGCSNASWELFDMSSGSQRRRGKVKAGRCTSVSVVPSGRVAFFGWDQLRDSKSGACLTMSELLDGPQTAAPKTADLPLESPGIVVCGSLSPDGTRLATLKVAANAESTVSVWELDKSFAAGGSPGERDIELGMAAAAVPPLLQSQRLLWWGFGLLLPLTALVLWTCVGAFAAAALVAALPALAIEFVKGLWSEKGYFVGTCTGLGYLTLALVALPFLAVAAVLALGLVAVAGPLYAMYQVTKSPYLLVYIPFVLPYQLTRARLQASALRQYRLKNVPSIVKIVYPVLVSSRASAEAPPANPDDAVATRIDDGKWSDEHLRQLAAMMTMPKELTLSGTQCQVAPTDVETTPFKNSFAVFASLGAPVRLIRAQYLVDLWERGAVMQMRQNLPYYAFYDSGPFDTGTHVIVVSCAAYTCTLIVPALLGSCVADAWLTRDHPDPFGFYVNLLGPLLVSFMATYGHRTAVFFDWMSLFQNKPAGSRSDKQSALFDIALDTMTLWYGHQRTHVWCLTKLPMDRARYEADPTATLFEYHGRGWPTFEFSIAGLITLAGRCLDIGLLPEPSGSADEGVHSYPYIQTACEARRRPPLSPEEFTALLATKHISNGADHAKIVKLFASAYTEILGTASTLRFVKLGWEDADVAKLAQALDACGRLQTLLLDDNPFGDVGAAALASHLPSTLTSVSLAGCSIGDDGVAAITGALEAAPLRVLSLSRCSRVGDAAARAIAAHWIATLADLQLDHTTVGDEGATALASCIATARNRGACALRSLNLWRTQVTCPNKAPRDEHQIHGFLVHFGAPPAAQPASTPLAPWMRASLSRGPQPSPRPERSPPSEIEVVRSMSRSALVLFFGDVYAYDDREAVRKLAAAPMSGEVLKLRTLKERAVLIVVQGTPGGGKHTFVNSSEGWAGVSTGRALAMYGSALDSTKLLVKHVKMKGLDFDILALGGRGKWMLRYGYLISAHCTATVFMADLSAIDARVLVEEGGGAASGEGGALCRFEHGGFKSQLEEFDALVNSRWFIATACILVLNKKDLLLQKLAALNVPARTYLPDYDGPIEEKPVTEHIKAMFSQKNRFKDKSVFTHVTTIIDPSNAKFVFNAAVAIILEANLRESGLA